MKWNDRNWSRFMAGSPVSSSSWEIHRKRQRDLLSLEVPIRVAFECQRKRRQRWRRRRCNASGLGWSVPSFWDWFSFTSPKTLTSLLAPKFPPLSPAFVVVSSFFLTNSSQLLLYSFIHFNCSYFAVAEGYWLKQSSMSPYAGFFSLHCSLLLLFLFIYSKNFQAVVCISRINVPWFSFVVDTSWTINSYKVYI